MEILPSDLMTYGTEAKTLLEDLQSRNERMFLVTVLVMNTAPSRQKLENNVFQAAGVAQKYNCALRRLDYQQEQGLVSSLPLGLNRIEIQRGLTTSSTAIFVPFTTQELLCRGTPCTTASTPSPITSLWWTGKSSKPKRPDSGNAWLREIVQCKA